MVYTGMDVCSMEKFHPKSSSSFVQIFPFQFIFVCLLIDCVCVVVFFSNNRHVDYTADERGFRAQVRTSEPGVAAQNPANVKIITEPLLPQLTPVPGGRILRPIETPGIFDPK